MALEWTLDAALKYTHLFMMKKKLVPYIAEVNRYGHRIIKTKNKEETYYWLFKEDYFRSFNNMFPEYADSKNKFGGYGETINVEYMVKAVRMKYTLLFCNGRLKDTVYTPSRQKLLEGLRQIEPEADFSNIHPTSLLKIYCDYHKLIRIQDRVNRREMPNSESIMEIQEQAYSFPFQIMERFNPEKVRR